MGINGCNRPPDGWYCTRDADHEGPCAAWPTAPHLTRPDRAEHYFEAHITVAPVFGQELENMRAIVAEFGFRVASLIMKKTAEETGEVSRDDTFCSARGESLQDITYRTVRACHCLEEVGFTVLRAKVEDTVWDTRISDPYDCIYRE